MPWWWAMKDADHAWSCPAATRAACSRWLRTCRSGRRSRRRSAAAGSAGGLGLHHQRQHGGVRGDDQVVAQAALAARVPGRRTRGTGSSCGVDGVVSRLGDAPRHAALACRMRSGVRPPPGRSGRAGCSGSSASPAAASGTRTSSRSTTAAWHRRRRRSANGPVRTSFPAATGPGRCRRSCTAGPPRPAGRRSRRRGGRRRCCSRSTADGAVVVQELAIHLRALTQRHAASRSNSAMQFAGADPRCAELDAWVRCQLAQRRDASLRASRSRTRCEIVSQCDALAHQQRVGPARGLRVHGAVSSTRSSTAMAHSSSSDIPCVGQGGRRGLTHRVEAPFERGTRRWG